MARVTVEDCIENIPNRFELVGLAACRAKQISSGNPITIDRDNDKDAVVSLREIAEKTVEFEPLRKEIIEGYSRFQRPDIVEGVEAPATLEQSKEAAAIADDSDAEEIEMTAEMEEELEEAAMIGDAPEGMDFGDEEIDVED